MSYIRRDANTRRRSTMNGRNELTGFVSLGVLLGILLGLTALPLAGCSQWASQSAPDETTASADTGSSMKVQGTVASGSLASDAAVASVPAPPAAPAAAPQATIPQATVPGAASAAAVPAPGVPPVTSPTSSALAVAAPLAPVLPPNLAQTNPPATAVVASTGPAVNVANTGSPVLKGLNGNGMQGEAQTLNPVMMRALKEFQVASASFPDFCRDWAHKLSVREHDNVEHIKWEMRDGVETGSYVGYSSIDSCTCKEATNGVAVGILTYKEFDYTLTGKSLEEARHATPHAATIVPTREIFAYEKGKWFW
jgi:hypothetical protein